MASTHVTARSLGTLPHPYTHTCKQEGNFLLCIVYDSTIHLTWCLKSVNERIWCKHVFPDMYTFPWDVHKAGLIWHVLLFYSSSLHSWTYWWELNVAIQLTVAKDDSLNHGEGMKLRACWIAAVWRCGQMNQCVSLFNNESALSFRMSL